jgi:aryl-alcohol dehydrogenase-like predicted oxidoreductase
VDTRVLGRTGLEVSVVGMGGIFISRYGGHSQEDIQRAVLRALELGVNYVDTAPNYDDGEEVLGRALEGAPYPHYLSTKVGGRPKPFNPQDADSLRRSVEDSLRLLGRDYIDILFIHEPDRPGQYDWWSDQVRYEGPVNDILDRLKAEGLIHFTGLAGTTAYELPSIIATGRYDVVLTAFNYSLLWREATLSVLPECVRQGVGVIAGSPLQHGALSKRYDDEIRERARWMSPPRREQYRRLYALVDEIGMPLPELALRFVLSQPAIHVTLVGARSTAEVEASVAAAEKGPLPKTLLDRLDDIAAMVPFRPFEEPHRLPFERPYAGPGPAELSG